jgi:flagellar basal-body rod modification protein FlgD
MAILLPPLTSGSGAPPTAAAAVLPPGAVDKNMFMKLLVAQLRHQDPMKPTDGMQFVAELAQFQQLEQTINAGQDIAAIRADLDLLAHPESQS